MKLGAIVESPIFFPFVLIASAKYYLGHNASVSILSPEYTSFVNFPVVAMQEQLMTFFNIVIILIFALIITEEYRSGQIRMIMIRVEFFKKLFFSKLAAALVTIFLLMILYYILSIGVSIGFLLLSFAYPTLTHMLGNINSVDSLVISKLQFLSLTHIQHMGIAIMLGDKPELVGLSVVILISYIMIFTIMNFGVFVIQVKDSGKGFSLKDINKIFNKFE